MTPGEGLTALILAGNRRGEIDPMAAAAGVLACLVFLSALTGGFLAGAQASSLTGCRCSAATASDSMRPWVSSSEIASTPERAKDDTWLPP